MNLRERADAIESGRLRWQQGPPVEIGTCCLAWDGMGNRPIPSFVLSDDQVKALADCIEPASSPPALVSEWNDEPGRTQSEVVAVLRKAADLLGEPS